MAPRKQKKHHSALLPLIRRTLKVRMALFCWKRLTMGLLAVALATPVRSFVVRSARSSAATLSATRLLAHEAREPIIPMTLLSGFLGSGKTTALKHLLENTEGLKIGVIVNDVASVNIDAKLISGTNQGIVELQNGCACCSLADELLTSVQTLLDNKSQLDAVVVELSGVADPVAIKSNWQTAKLEKHPVTLRADVAKVVTVVDACTFGTDWMTWDLAEDRSGWVDQGDDCAGQRKVPELLAEQVEAANLIIINKIDLAGPEQVKVASSLARGLNKDAILQEVAFGKVSPKQLLGKLEIPKVQDKNHDHAHSHDHACAEPDCSDTSHDHSHAHDNACSDPVCTDPSHDHDHHEEACADPDCTDATHSHSHSHSHSTSTDKLGIVNFVYKATKPFQPKRLMALLNEWPVPIKDYLDLEILHEAQEEGYSVRGRLLKGSPFIGVLRSKGFCWFSPTKWSGSKDDVWRHDTAMYWSHAGKHFGISSAGKWWGTVSTQQMKKYFTDTEEYEKILREDFLSEEWADRRQEIVFIGTKLKEEEITKALDECLCTDNEMTIYRQKLRNYMDTTVSTKSASLFDVARTDHMDVK